MLRYVSLREAAPGVLRVEKQAAEEPDLLLTLKSSGDMKDARNLMRLEEKGIPLPLTLKQVHSRRVVWADEIGSDEIGSAREDTEADGLLSSDPEVSLGVTVADCMPIYLFAPDPRAGIDFQTGIDVRAGIDPQTGINTGPEKDSRPETDPHAAAAGLRGSWVFGILHSGWKGTGIVGEALELMRQRMGVEAESVSAVLGPSIRSCCYRVDNERGKLFSSLWGEDAIHFDKKSGETSLDLVQANLGILRDGGVKDIRVVDACTQCDTRFGSFRREGPERFTHMLAITGFFK